LETVIACPVCGSESVWKDGWRKIEEKRVQRYLCRDCGYKFTLFHRKKHVINSKTNNNQILCQNNAINEDEIKAILEKYIELYPDIYLTDDFIDTTSPGLNNRVCASESAKNLVEAKQTGASGEKITKQQILYDYLWYMKKEGYSKATVEGRVSILNTLFNRQVNIHDPDSVKEYLASQDCSNGRKRNIVHAISCYYKLRDITWDPPRYRRVRQIPWISQEKQVDKLIAAVPNKYKPFLQILKETGMRPGEAWQLRWQDIDYATKQVRITPEKGSNPRVLPISNQLIAMLNLLPRENEWVFKNGKKQHFSEGYRRHRKKIAKRLGDPDLTRITFKTFRHYKGTMEYHKTKDILHVKMVLGHKNIKNTLVYTQLIDFREDEYITKVARNSEEACQLIESGFEYVLTAPDELMIFKKRK